MDRELLLQTWVKVRETIDGFDRAVAANRKQYGAAIGAIATATVYFTQQLLQPDSVFLATFLIAVAVLGTSVAFWSLDGRYRHYLRIAAATARNLEKEISLAGMRIGLTTNLHLYINRALYRREKFRFKHEPFNHMYSVYNFLYLLPPLGVSLAIACLSLATSYLGTHEVYALFLSAGVAGATLAYWYRMGRHDSFCTEHLRREFPES